MFIEPTTVLPMRYLLYLRGGPELSFNSSEWEEMLFELEEASKHSLERRGPPL